jgi:hypothetical protein
MGVMVMTKAEFDEKKKYTLKELDEAGAKYSRYIAGPLTQNENPPSYTSESSKALNRWLKAKEEFIKFHRESIGE